jgi:Rrf2 family protein
MFQVKARVDYGFMIMLELATHPRQVTPLSIIAKRMGVSSIYLIQIARSLSQAGLIKSKEGAGGGYYLAKPASRISVLDIVEALDGEIAVGCALDKSGSCPNHSGCHIIGIWESVIPDLRAVLQKRRLSSFF